MTRTESQRLFPTLKVTDACNKSCSACLRSPETSRPALRHAEVVRYFGDLERLSHRYAIKYQFITGGEPTLWRDGTLDIVDLLAEVRSLSFVDTVMLPTNGTLFEDEKAACSFVSRLSARIQSPVLVGVSVASFQNNLDAQRCVALDNLLASSREPGTKVIPFLLVTLGTADDTSDALAKAYPSVMQRVTALAPLGRASSLTTDCPSLVLDSTDKASLGSFARHFKRDVMEKLGLSEAGYDDAPNAELLNGLSLFNNCGQSPFVDDRWHYCLPMLDDAQFDLGAIGEVEPQELDRFVAKRPWLQEIREHGVIAAVSRNLSGLSSRTREHVEQILAGGIPVPVAYRGCMACKMFHDLGVWREFQAALEPRGDAAFGSQR